MAIAQIEASLKRVGLDRYMMLLILMVVLATLLPARGASAEVLTQVTYWAVGLLFFIYGAKLSTATILAGLSNWKLQISCLMCTYAVFPLLGLALAPIASLYLPSAFAIGILYIGCLPSTVQSSIAFTSVAKGNVAGAVCAASVSNILGVFMAPLLFALLIPSSTGVEIGADAVWKILQQILLPFAVGQLCRPLIGGWLNRHKQITGIVDRGSILLIVYSAFSAGVVNGIWHVVDAQHMFGLWLLVAFMLAAGMTISMLAGRAGGMDRGDLVALFYCGSTKSLATGLPMAGVLFAGQDVAMIVLPLMFFHTTKLFACAIISQRQAMAIAATA
ncbi:bile acid:sodium symporter family protein [Paracoccus aminophilus]|uniref:Bile acid:sodium symporter n=1 Tax=Paracoccus aminophilus JCM 7686 TaxID=1367847 RepID=S5Y117_PARAH|nr:bile acid:sodium symporter family protein [Paracoccus aminophilus]AGT09405.1 bile acid:sodium symporter [Paracoccus aminophilus JCM 7686]